jgi:tRNA nucleotidyltransferase (CCA-adding enzyme)
MTIADIIKRLCDAGHHAYITGGAVRDVLAGLPAKDEDIVTDATPEELQVLFPDYKVVTVGKSFGVTLIDGIEVATFRTDKYAGLDARKCLVEFVNSLEEDLSRRDLTINAMAFCEQSGDIIDPHDGQGDLKKKVIRFVGDPVDRIYEDPNRIIRACRFLAKIEGSFDCTTFEALSSHATFVRDNIAKERIRLEILKALELPKPSLFFMALFDIGALQYIFPSLVPCAAHIHGKHHREDVFTHCMICGDHISPKRPLLRLAGYLHDAGKPVSHTADGKFIGHELESANLANAELRKLRFSTDEVEKVVNLILCHMLSIHDKTRTVVGKKAFRRFLAKLNEHEVSFDDFVRLRVADRKANLAKDDFTFREIRGIRRQYITVINDKPAFSVRDLAIDGKDVKDTLHISPGPEIGRYLRSLFEFVLEHGPEVNNREDLLWKLQDIK